MTTLRSFLSFLTRLEDAKLINGVLVQKRFSNSQMQKEMRNIRVALLLFPLDAQSPKTKHNINIKSVDEYKSIQDHGKNKTKEIIDTIKEVGADLIFCPYKIKKDLNHILVQENISAIELVSSEDIEKLAMATRGKIVGKLDELTADKLGKVECVREVEVGANSMIIVEGCGKENNVVTILIRGSNRMIVEEAKRSIHDTLCVAHNLILDNRLVYGGGSAELVSSIAVERQADSVATLEQYACWAYGEALESIPVALAENSGYSPIQVIMELKSRQIAEYSPALGVNCMLTGNNDMREQRVIKPLVSKQHQIMAATQLVNMIWMSEMTKSFIV